jgi:metal-sulfur cluster biosynthetic enzyme
MEKIEERNENFKKRMDELIANPHWNCRHHPTDWWHENGCPHKDWTKEEIHRALVLAKASLQVNLEVPFQSQPTPITEEEFKKFVDKCLDDWCVGSCVDSSEAYIAQQIFFNFTLVKKG